MSRCRQARLVQDYLDGELAPKRAAAFAEHLHSCAACRTEAEAFAGLFAALREARLPDSAPLLTERILDRVVPSRLRRRWVRAAGWAYAAACAFSTLLFVWWIARPETHLWLAKQYGAASLRVMQGGLFALETITRSWLEVVEGWNFLSKIGDRAQPLLRALAVPLTDPLLAAMVASAVVACAGVLWWMRRGPAREGVRNVSVLGF